MSVAEKDVWSCTPFLSAIQHHCSVSAVEYQLCVLGDGASFENGPGTAILKHMACCEPEGEKKKQRILLGFLNTHCVNSNKKKIKL